MLQYSFGIIMWELATRKTPWYELNAVDYLDMFSKLDVALRDGRRPFLPPAFAERHALFTDTLRDCWSEDPTLRPSFATVVQTLADVPGAMAPKSVEPALVTRMMNAAAETTAESGHVENDSDKAPFAFATEVGPRCVAKSVYEDDDASIIQRGDSDLPI